MSEKPNFNFTPSKDYGDDWAGYFLERREYIEAERLKHGISFVKPGKGDVNYVEKTDTKVYASGEVSLDEIVPTNKNGSYNRQSVMGKVADLLTHREVEVKAGKSVYKKGEGPLTEHTWIQAAGNGLRIVATGTDITYNGMLVSYNELEELLEDR